MRRNRIVERLMEKVRQDQEREEMLRATKALVDLLHRSGKVTIHYTSCLDNLPPKESCFE